MQNKDVIGYKYSDEVRHSYSEQSDFAHMVLNALGVKITEVSLNMYTNTPAEIITFLDNTDKYTVEITKDGIRLLNHCIA